ncbi:hypothetical protein RYX36_021218 [Vicia faba]
MSDEEHHFKSKANVGASKTYNQQADIILKNGYIVIKNHPCKIKVGFYEGKDLVVSVVFAMGEEQIHALKDYHKKGISNFSRRLSSKHREHQKRILVWVQFLLKMLERV